MKRPVLHLTFGWGASISSGVKLPTYPPPRTARPGKMIRRGRPRDLQEWVKQLPGRRFDGDLGCWVVHSPGPEIDRVLADLEFDLDMGKAAARGITRLADLATPIIELDPDDPYNTLILPRFADPGSSLPTGAVWNGKASRFEVYTPDLATWSGEVPAQIRAKARDLMTRPVPALTGQDERADWPTVFARLPRAPKRLPAGLPELPSWGGMTPYGYQVSGTYAVLGGRSLLADAPGLGKTLQAIAAATLTGAQRTIVLVPPVALTNWGREISRYGLAFHSGDPARREGSHTLAVIHPTRKVPPLPERGVVVVPDSVLVARPALLAELMAWKPDAAVADESHRYQTWESERSRVARRVFHTVAENGGVLRLPMSGTPMLASPVQLVTQLALSGHLTSVFGGRANFLTEFARPDGFGGWVARAKALPRLRRTLDEQVWTRRLPKDVYNRAGGPMLPPVLPPRVRFVDVDLKGYRLALKKQEELIDDWLSAFGGNPGQDDLEGFYRDAIRFISPLRKAAGLAKVEAATEYALSWAEEEAGEHNDSPLLVWYHHHEVGESLMGALDNGDVPAAQISGATPAARRGKIKDDFQDGAYRILVLSLQAAGVALTLTRGKDNLFVETDWTPSIMTQARDRTARLGQERSVTLTTMVAPGTMDEHMQLVQASKAVDLDVVMGEGNDVSVLETEGLMTPREIVAEMVERRIRAYRPGRQRRAA